LFNFSLRQIVKKRFLCSGEYSPEGRLNRAAKRPRPIKQRWVTTTILQLLYVFFSC